MSSNIKFSQLPNLGTITANTTVPVVAAGTNYTITAANLQSYVNSSTGNVTANYFIGNGSQLTGLPATYGNANVVANLAALGSNPVSTTGNITGGNILGVNNISTGTITLTNGAVILDTADGAVAFGSGAGISPQGEYAVAMGFSAGQGSQGNAAVAIGGGAGETSQGDSAVAIGYQAGGTNQGNNSIIINATGTTLDQTTANTFTVAPVRNDVANTSQVMFYNTTSKEITYGNTISVAGNITAANFVGNGNTLSNVATQVTGSWTVPTGNSTQSFTVAASKTYLMWVDCNIPNGILAWNATATVTNTNVPVVGAQYAWVYNGGGSPIDFTSIPNQFVGTANSIVRSSTAPSATTNRFDFGINNTSGGNVTVRYGWTKIS